MILPAFKKSRTLQAVGHDVRVTNLGPEAGGTSKVLCDLGLIFLCESKD